MCARERFFRNACMYDNFKDYLPVITRVYVRFFDSHNARIRIKSFPTLKKNTMCS